MCRPRSYPGGLPWKKLLPRGPAGIPFVPKVRIDTVGFLRLYGPGKVENSDESLLYLPHPKKLLYMPGWKAEF